MYKIFDKSDFCIQSYSALQGAIEYIKDCVDIDIKCCNESKYTIRDNNDNIILEMNSKNIDLFSYDDMLFTLEFMIKEMKDYYNADMLCVKDIDNFKTLANNFCDRYYNEHVIDCDNLSVFC